MYLAIVLLPLFSAIGGGLFGRFLGSKGAGLLTTSCIFLTALLSWKSYLGFLGYDGSGSSEGPKWLKVASWIDSDSLLISWGLQIDSVTVTMLVLVTTISTLVHMYSTSYMDGDPHLPKFLCYLSLFTFCMLILVTGDNLLSLFVGWEGVGLCSYLLINFWSTIIQANKSAIKAMVMNRVGDLGFTLAMLLVYYTFGSIDFSTIAALAPSSQFETTSLWPIAQTEISPINNFTAIGILFFIGAAGKSAQLGLHSWLPDAMAGPTPVSSLLHSATMVTAGVFLLIRLSPILEFTPNALFIIAIIGGLTAFFAASVATVQNDLKKIIAFSTCSQLGYMVFCCGLSNYNVALSHLFQHGFFKALLFLSAGSIIHALGDEQDIRRMGGIINYLPFTYSVMTIGSLSLMGFPWLSGFYSKDLVLEIAAAVGEFNTTGSFVFLLGSLSAFLTAFYSMRLIYFVFIANTSTYRNHFSHIHESPWPMIFPLASLAFLSIFSGYFTRDSFVGMATTFWNNSLTILPGHITIIESEFLPAHIKLIPLIFSLSGAFLSILTYYAFNPLLFSIKISTHQLYSFLSNRWYIDFIYNSFIAKTTLHFGHLISYKLIDRGLLEKIGPNSIYSQLTKLVKNITILQSGYIFQYALLVFSYTIFFLFFKDLTIYTITLLIPLITLFFL